MNFLSFLLQKPLEVIKNRKLCVTLHIAMLVIGILLGIVIREQYSIQSYLDDYVRDYVEAIFTSGFFYFIWKNLIALAFFLFLYLLACFCPILQFFLWIYQFFKAVSLGKLTILIFSIYKISGIAVCIFVFLPFYLLKWSAKSVYCICFYDSVGLLNRRKVNCFHEVAPHTYAFLVYYILILLFELLTIFLIFRPIYHFF